MSTTLTFERFVKDDSFVSDGNTAAIYNLKTMFFQLQLCEYVAELELNPHVTWLAQVLYLDPETGNVEMRRNPLFDTHFTIVDSSVEAVEQLATLLGRLWGDLGLCLEPRL